MRRLASAPRSAKLSRRWRKSALSPGFVMLARIGDKALGHLTAAFILERDASDAPGEALTDQPGNPKRSLVIAKPGGVDVGNTIAFGVGETDLGREGDIGPEAVGGR